MAPGLRMRGSERRRPPAARGGRARSPGESDGAACSSRDGRVADDRTETLRRRYAGRRGGCGAARGHWQGGLNVLPKVQSAPEIAGISAAHAQELPSWRLRWGGGAVPGRWLFIHSFPGLPWHRWPRAGLAAGSLPLCRDAASAVRGVPGREWNGTGLLSLSRKERIDLADRSPGPSQPPPQPELTQRPQLRSPGLSCSRGHCPGDKGQPLSHGPTSPSGGEGGAGMAGSQACLELQGVSRLQGGAGWAVDSCAG